MKFNSQHRASVPMFSRLAAPVFSSGALSSALLLLGMSLSPVALAVADATHAETSESEVENIQVTGSHIKGVDLEGAQPLTVISADDIKSSGAASITDLLRDLGVTRGGEGSFNTSTSGALSSSTPAGAAAASLRGLGASSTLTLVNGRRVAASSFAAGTENFVDINAIPIAAIDRIEILATGASASYGADAVAGVINYILRKDYQGAELNLSYGNSFDSTDEGRTGVNFIWGQNFGEHNVTLFADLFDRQAFHYRDRDMTRDTFSLSSFGKYPSVRYNNSNVEDDAGNFIGFEDLSCPSELVRVDPSFGDRTCGYNPNDDSLLRPELKTYSVGALHRWEGDDIQWFNEVFYSHTQSSSISSPAKFADLDDRSSWIRIGYDNPAIQNNDALRDAIYATGVTSPNGADVDGLQIRGRFLAPRAIENETTSYRIVTGLSGSWESWDWETAINYSRSESDQVAIGGVYNRNKFNAALFGELCADGSTTCSPNDDGLWFNPFEGQTGNEQVLALMNERVSRAGESELIGWDAKFSGDLFEVESGAVAAAFGVEYRHEKISDNPSELARAKFDSDYLVDVIGFGSSAADASRNQYALFSEFYVPITDKLDAQVALRYDYYDDFGGDVNPKIGLRYQANDALLWRASWATSFRAPSLTQAGVDLRTTTTTARCLSEYSAFYCNNDVTGEISPNTLEVGNPNLQAEEAESWNFGLAYSPTDDITLTVDYWRYEHENVVDTDLESMMLRSISDPSVRFCGLVPSDQVGLAFDPEMCASLGLATGFTESLDSVLARWTALNGDRTNGLELYRDHILMLENTGTQETHGLDVTYTQYIDTESSGKFTLLFDATRLFGFERNRTLYSGSEQLAGTFRYPKTVASMKLRWRYEDWSASLAANYTSKYRDEVDLLSQQDIDTLAAQGIASDRNVPSWTIFNANLRYDIQEDMQLSFTINNILDRDAPFVYGRYLNADLLNHDVNGRTFRLMFTYFLD